MFEIWVATSEQDAYLSIGDLQLPCIAKGGNKVDAERAVSPIMLETRTATSLLDCFLGIPLPESDYPNNDPCPDIGMSSPTERLSDPDRVKKLIFGYARMSWKTLMDSPKPRERPPRSNFLIDWWIKMDFKKVVSKNRCIKMRPKSETFDIRAEDVEARNKIC
jgi:hypothetical protein